MDHVMAGEHELAELAVRSVGENEIGVEEQEERLCHLVAEVEETAIKRLGQHHPVVTGPI